MANTTPSPVMNMPVPVVGTDPSPTWGYDLDACLNILDGHDHTPGLGNPITPSAMAINADLSMGTFNLIDVRSIRWTPQNSPLALPADTGIAYVSGLDLWYNDVNGNQIQITANGGVAGTPGSIANLVAPASASYVAGTKTFVFQSDVNQAANLDAASIILRNIPGTFGLTLSPPTLGSNYTITLPVLPSVQSFMVIDNSGTVGATIPINLGIDTGNIAANAIVTSKIADDQITLAKMTDDSVGTNELIDASVTPIKMAPFVINNVGVGSNVISSTSYVDIATITLTVTGLRPVLVLVNNFNNGNNPGFLSVIDAINPPVGIMAINGNAGDLSITEVSTSVIGATMTVPASMSIIDQPSAGTKTYKIRAKVLSATTNFTLQNIQIVAYEL